MVSYAHGIGEQPLLAQTIGENLRRTTARVGAGDALISVHQGLQYTYAEFDEAVDRVAGSLVAAGLRKGDRVGIWSPNRAEWPLVQYATARAGVILVNVNPAYRFGEVQFALRQSGCRWLFAASESDGVDFRAIVTTARHELPGLERAIFFDTAEWDDVAAGDASPRTPDGLRRRMAELDFDDPISIQYTSGTTGFAKGATLSHHNILNNAYQLGTMLRYGPSDRICIPVPLYHCFGMVMGNLAASTHGACIVYPAETFDPRATLQACQDHRCTSLYGVPTMFIAELDHPEFDSFDLSSLRTGIMAGSPCPIELVRSVATDMGIEEMSIVFGMTETSSVTTATRIDDTLEHRSATVGQVMPHTEIKIVGVGGHDSGRPLPRGRPGELCARGYLVMRGYWNDSERTAEAIDQAHWMRTGDLATMDQDGYVRIVGRIKDMIIRGGENVYPREIEEFLQTHRDIADVQVIGVPDRRYGEEVMAWIIPRPRSELTEQHVREFCDGQIAPFKIPRYVKIVDSFPMTVTGKVQKFKLREQATTELGLQEAATGANA